MEWVFTFACRFGLLCLYEFAFMGIKYRWIRGGACFVIIGMFRLDAILDVAWHGGCGVGIF